jgi:hypothetical protein
MGHEVCRSWVLSGISAGHDHMRAFRSPKTTSFGQMLGKGGPRGGGSSRPLNYLLSSHAEREDHNRLSHQDPGFIDSVLTKRRR